VSEKVLETKLIKVRSDEDGDDQIIEEKILTPSSFVIKKTKLGVIDQLKTPNNKNPQFAVSIPVNHETTTTPKAKPLTPTKIRQLPIVNATNIIQMMALQTNSRELTKTNNNSDEAIFLSESTCILDQTNGHMNTTVDMDTRSNKSSSGSDSRLNSTSNTNGNGFLRMAHFKVLAQFQSDQENLIRQHYRHHFAKVHNEQH
jgi:hypothetical protein